MRRSPQQSQSRFYVPTLVLLGVILLFLFLSTTQGRTTGLRRSGGGDSHKSSQNKLTMSASGSMLRGAVERVAPVPRLLYGTAWKKDRSAALVEQALRAGFRGIDTACQPKHYNELGVGEGIRNAVAKGVLTRADLFLQTKFTSLSGQDKNNVPYDTSASLPDMVKQSLAASMRNLGTDYLDSLVMHSPMRRPEDTLVVWRTFEEFVKDGRVRYLGLSNCYDLGTLAAIWEAAEIKPRFLQNRFYRESGYDKELRAYCKEKGITYQSFWTLTANPDMLKSAPVRALAKKYGKTVEQIWFAFVMHQPGSPMVLTGTTSDAHMREDLETPSISLSDDEVQSVAVLLE
jgi:diketogulonate reductase-like aldo/keto reductase